MPLPILPIHWTEKAFRVSRLLFIEEISIETISPPAQDFDYSGGERAGEKCLWAGSGQQERKTYTVVVPPTPWFLSCCRSSSNTSFHRRSSVSDLAFFPFHSKLRCVSFLTLLSVSPTPFASFRALGRPFLCTFATRARVSVQVFFSSPAFLLSRVFATPVNRRSVSWICGTVYLRGCEVCGLFWQSCSSRPISSGVQWFVWTCQLCIGYFFVCCTEAPLRELASMTEVFLIYVAFSSIFWNAPYGALFVGNHLRLLVAGRLFDWAELVYGSSLEAEDTKVCARVFGSHLNSLMSNICILTSHDLQGRHA